jgi:AcrR family transcriptional regulator
MKAGMEDRREALIDAGLQILREEGLAGFTQPKVAARVGLRQGNLTYYFPTRVDLMAAVARVAVERQLAAAAEMVRNATSADKAISIIAGVVVRHENTRVLVALNQAADQEPALRELFNELTDGFVAQLELLLANLGLGPSRDRIDMLHALFVGLSVIDLATSRRNGKARAKAALETAFGLLATDAPSQLQGTP